MARINQRCGFVKPFLRRSNIGAFLPARTEVKKTFGGSSANCPAKVSTQVRDYSSSQRDAGDQPVVEPPANLHRASDAKTCVETLAVQFARFVHSLLDRRLREPFTRPGSSGRFEFGSGAKWTIRATLVDQFLDSRAPRFFDVVRAHSSRRAAIGSTLDARRAGR